jgi:hypothetical protein
MEDNKATKIFDDKPVIDCFQSWSPVESNKWPVFDVQFTMLLISLLLVIAPVAFGQMRVDNVLVKMVPPGSTALMGVHMDQVRQTALYRKLLADQNLTQLDQFSRETGFDPRRDVRELLFATTPQGGVMLARGAFHLNPPALKEMKKTRHGEYEIWNNGKNGFCLLDSTLAVAGEIPAIEAALEEWKSGSHTAAQSLLARAVNVNPHAQIWGISTGAASFLADHLPPASSGLDFSKVFRGLEDTWFQADLNAGLRAEVHGTTSSEKDAINLRDAVRGMVGLGRLNVPENQPEMLRLWDGVTVDQQGRALTLRADIAQELIDRLVQMLGGDTSGRRRI